MYEDKHIFVKADKTTNHYKTEPKDYMTLLNRNVTKSYKKTDHNVPIDIATKDKQFAENLNLTTELMYQRTEIHLSH